jgi:hypothetical protein
MFLLTVRERAIMPDLYGWRNVFVRNTAICPRVLELEGQ